MGVSYDDSGGGGIRVVNTGGSGGGGGGQPKVGDVVGTLPDGSQIVITGFEPQYGYDANGDPAIMGQTPTTTRITYPQGSTAKGPVSVVSVQPQGYGYVLVTYSDGSSQLTQDNSPGAGQQPTYYDPASTPIGYSPTKDTGGHVTGYVNDPSYQKPGVSVVSVTPSSPGYVNVKYSDGSSNLATDPSYTQPKQPVGGLVKGADGYYYTTDPSGNKTGYIQDPTYQPTSAGVQDLGNGMYGVKSSSGDGYTGYGNTPGYVSPEQIREFDANLNASIADNQARLKEQQAEASMAHGDRLAAINADIANTKATLANQLHIATIQDATTRWQTGVQAGVNMRGQNMDYASQSRGQDITREGNVISGVGNYYTTASQLSNDPIRQADLLVGGSGLGTPDALAASDYRNFIGKLTSTYKPVGAAADVSTFKTPTLKAAKGMTPGQVNVMVGDSESGRPTGHEEVLELTKQPDGSYRFMGVIPHDKINGLPIHARAALGAPGPAGQATGPGTIERHTVGYKDAAHPNMVWNGVRWTRDINDRPAAVAAPAPATAGSNGAPGSMGQPNGPGSGVSVGESGPSGSGVVVAQPSTSAGYAASGYGTMNTGVQDTGPNVQHAPTSIPGATNYSGNAITDDEVHAAMGTLDAMDEATLYAHGHLVRRNGQYYVRTLMGRLNPASPDFLANQVRTSAQRNGVQPGATTANPAGYTDSLHPGQTWDGTKWTTNPAGGGGVTLDPIDAILGSAGLGTPTDAASLAAAREKVKNLLAGIVGGTPDATNLNIPDVYGVKLGNPQDYAGDNFTTMSDARKNLLYSGYAAAMGSTPNEASDWFNTVRNRYRPNALSGVPVVSYG